LVEHKIQLKDEKQTADLPLSKEELEIFAKKFGFKTDEFLRIYNKITDAVHGIYKTIFYAHSIPIFSPVENLESFFEEEFGDYKQISIQIGDIARKSKFVKSNHTILSAGLDKVYKQLKNMKKSLSSKLFLNVLSGFNSILPNYYDTFFGNNYIFNTATLAFSLGLHQKLKQYPFLVDEFFYIDQPLEILELTKQEKERLEFNLALKLLSENLDKKNKKVLSIFAQNFIKHLIEKLEIKDLVVLAYGKLGIEELFINSDLDLVFLAKSVDDKKISEVSNLIKELNKIYNVDLRLRPFGEKGLIVSEVEYFKTYLLKYAKDWEKLAIQKARIIYSDFECDLKGSITEFARFVDKKSIRDMKNLIETHKGFDIKSAKGGIVDIEFILQYICTLKGCFEFGKSLEAMINEILDVKDVKLLIAIYAYFSNILNLMRLIPNDFKDKIAVLEYLLNISNIEHKIKKLQQKVSRIFDRYFIE
jgi:glutamate-ammonia-ligase adenylyltransferase